MLYIGKKHTLFYVELPVRTHLYLFVYSRNSLLIDFALSGYDELDMFYVSLRYKQIT